jgi:hypothetical protein
MAVIVSILGVMTLSGLGVAVAYLTSGRVGYEVTLWGSAAFVFFGMAFGLRHSVMEGIVGVGVYTAVGYLILKTIPEILPIFGGACAGLSLFILVIGVIGESEEAPQRDAEQRVLEEQRTRDEALLSNQEADWLEYRKHVATLPVATPKAGIGECLEVFRTYLNRVWSQLPPELFEPKDYGYELIHTWLQRQFERIVEKPLGCGIDRFYGEYDMEYDDDLPEKERPKRETPKCQPMEIWVNEKYEFDCLVSIRDGWHYTQPPFDYVLVYEDVGPDIPGKERYIPFDQARFELRPASWISKS